VAATLVVLAMANPPAADAAAASDPITLPSLVAGMSPLSTLKPTANVSGLSKLSQREQETMALIAKRVSFAYGGAPATARVYHDPALRDQILVIAVRKHSPGLFATAGSADSLGLTLPVQEVDSFGPVQCLVRNDIVAKGQPIPKDVHNTVRCQRSDSHLTLITENWASEGAYAHDPSALAKFTNSVWRAIG
jgi:hypothetical protein